MLLSEALALETTLPNRPPLPSNSDALSSGAALELTEVTKTYRLSGEDVHALRSVSVRLEPGTFTAVMGPSGSGKSTFLHCASGLDTPTSGRVMIGGQDLSGYSERRLTLFRRDHVGFIFQAYLLIPTLTVEDNITLPLRLSGRPVDKKWALEVVQQVGMADQLHRRPSELSGGQQQRVAIARALIARPNLLMADEPTGALDSTTGTQVLELLAVVSSRLGQTVVMVTHDARAAAYADEVLFLADGQLVDRLTGASVQDIAARMARLGERRS